MEPPEKPGHPGLVTGAQKSAKDSGTRNKMMLPSSVANQSYSVSASSPAPASTSIPSSEGSLVPSEAADGGGTHESHDAINVDSDVEQQPVTKKAKKTTSEVWQYFTKYWATVEYKERTAAAHNKKKNNETGIATVQSYKYDQEASLRKFYEAMIVHEYPFNMVEHEFVQEWVKSMRPNYPLKSRVTVRKEIMECYSAERDKLYEYFKTIQSRFSATMDMWTSNQNKGYMCVTLHWVDDDWKIQKRIINFLHVEGRHTGERLSYTDTTICGMANAMSVKFDKYWKKSNIAIAVANVLDPRFKRRIVEFYLRKFYNNSYQAELEKFNGIIRKMFQCYVSVAPSSSKSNKEVEEPLADLFMGSNNIDDELDNYLFESDSYDADGEFSELERYLAEPPLKTTKANQNMFDILAWWKSHKEEYPVLSRLTRDVLTIQVSTVASESAFSAGGRVIDPYRSRLDPDMVQALVCTKDWIIATRKGSKNVSSLPGDLDVLEAIKNNLMFEDEFSEMGRDDDVAIDNDDLPEIQL
ncbi:Zinc finger BED domain-containing protein DAYSLEEPER [Striga hermonthica]|uniref:Zinc finger BED domain-containing protein DAYSLEEPER n=1 Tax=Striga hermonthica TaxID=68872 RepID=A0A9N7P2E8_STRHE|nr:Zinc finger BED domain-containing protein DAYSLEEPER [Striga hermonthica]